MKLCLRAPSAASLRLTWYSLQHWIKIDWKKHPDAVTAENGNSNGNGSSTGKTHDEIEQLIFDAIIKEGALVALGNWFQTDQAHADADADAAGAADPGVYFRLTFASAPHEKIVEGVRRLGVALRKVFHIKEEAEGGVSAVAN
ncbi:Aromatic/aminoadipate aminotransferase 1 [Ascosphaera acerosa]|nr:Aromatic/aminoadipate aminotransferase 1 [Ascosphaera acerosa]